MGGCGQKKKQTALQLCLHSRAMRTSGDSFTTAACTQLTYLSQLAQAAELGFVLLYSQTTAKALQYF